MSNYQVVRNIHLDSLNTRYSYLPTDSKDNLIPYHLKNFAIVADGNITINYNNDNTNDLFSVDIHLARASYTYSYNKKEDVKCVNKQVFMISIGDIFKHYYKTNLDAITSLVTKKKKRLNGRKVHDEETEQDDENNFMNELIEKSLKVNQNNSDVRVILGSIENWDHHHMRLWSELLAQGYVKALGHDFASFCNTFIVLPLHQYDSNQPSVADYLSHISSHVLIKKLLKYFVTGEDPSERNWERVAPTRDYFEQPKSIVDIFEKYSKELSENFPQYERVKRELARELSAKHKNELNEKYLPACFDNISCVGRTYPMHAFRTIHLMSWCITDFNQLEELMDMAAFVGKSDKNKHIIEKRGKFQKYETYTDATWYDNYREYVPKTHKYAVVHTALSM